VAGKSGWWTAERVGVVIGAASLVVALAALGRDYWNVNAPTAPTPSTAVPSTPAAAQPMPPSPSTPPPVSQATVPDTELPSLGGFGTDGGQSGTGSDTSVQDARQSISSNVERSFRDLDGR
jgi:hypothetical protein